MEERIRPPAVGKRIKELRKEQNLTMDELSLKSGVSKSMLSQIESDQTNPTIATVWKIASGLNITFQTLLEGRQEPAGRWEVTHAEETVILDSLAEGTQVEVLSPLSMADDLEFYLLTLKKGGCLVSSSHFHGTEEFLTVLAGEIKVTSGSHSQVLKTGDFIIYNADVEHSLENVGTDTASAHLVNRFAGEARS